MHIAGSIRHEVEPAAGDGAPSGPPHPSPPDASGRSQRESRRSMNMRIIALLTLALVSAIALPAAEIAVSTTVASGWCCETGDDPATSTVEAVASVFRGMRISPEGLGIAAIFDNGFLVGVDGRQANSGRNRLGALAGTVGKLYRAPKRLAAGPIVRVGRHGGWGGIEDGTPEGMEFGGGAAWRLRLLKNIGLFGTVEYTRMTGTRGGDPTMVSQGAHHGAVMRLGVTFR